MSEMVERIEKALENYLHGDGAAFKAAARAVLEAMREPTPEMLIAAVPYPLHLVIERDEKYRGPMEAATMADRITARQTYQALIDAALQ